DKFFISALEKELIEREGSLYEENFYTMFIERALAQLKDNETIETILILDDLDRIDPHHIFRLLNVFASHFDSKEGKKNKFGFDKVMFVCDINNIKNTFAATYGSNVDFNGYMDKFYSKAIHFHKFNDHALSLVNQIVNLITIDYKYGQSETFSFVDRSKPIVEDYRFLISSMLESGVINLRSFLKFYQKEIKISIKKLPIYGTRYVYSHYFRIVTLFDFFIQHFGTAEALMTALKKTYNSDQGKMQNYKYMLGDAILFLTVGEHKMITGEYNLVIDSKFRIDYTIVNQAQGTYCSIKKIELATSGEVEFGPDIFSVYRQCLQLLIRLQYYQ